MSIRHISYLACDECLEICDDSDADTGSDARHIGKRRGWKQIEGKDLCRKCQANGNHDYRLGPGYGYPDRPIAPWETQ